MKNKFAVLLAVLALIFTPFVAQARVLPIHNLLDVDIVEIYMSDSNVDDWEEDILGNGILEAGETLQVTIQGAFDQFDILVIDRNGKQTTGFQIRGNVLSVLVTPDGIVTMRP
jgi:hypothetical protein